MREKLLSVLGKVKYGVVFAALIFAFLLIVFWKKVAYITPVGHASVEWYSIGPRARASRGPLGEGLHLIFPWNRFYTYDLRLQKKDATYPVVTQDGLHFDVDMTFRWQVKRENLVRLNQQFGPDYLDKLLIPEIGSVLRRVVASYTAEALYTSRRNEVQDQVFREVTRETLPNGLSADTAVDTNGTTILLHDILLTRVDLPQDLKDAIERKLQEAELVKEYAFRVKREQLESERKAIEAEGIRRFQETVAPAITQSYLQWRGIEATLELAKSENAKVVIIGNSESGLPVILDTGKTQ